MRSFLQFTLRAMLIAAFYENATLSKAAQTWTGATSGVLTDASNWTPGLPTANNSATSDVIFTTSGNTSLQVSGTLGYRNMTFNAGGDGFTFNDSGANDSNFVFNLASPTATRTINNLSSNAQTFNTTQVGITRGRLVATNGDFIINAPFNAGNGGVTVGLNVVNLDGAKDIHLNFGFVGNSGQRVDKNGTGTLFLAESPFDPTLNIGSYSPTGRWGGQLSIADGKVEINSSGSLGEVGDQTTHEGWTEVRANGNLVLTNNINTGELMFLGGRPASTATVSNKSGTNTLSGNLFALADAVNNTISLQSDGTAGGDQFVVSGELAQINDSVTAVLNLQGAGGGLISGTITQPSSTTALFGIPVITNNVWNVVKNDAGTWTLSGSNSYTGSTTVNQGTLALGATGSIASSSSINVKSGATFDVSAVPGGFTLGSAQTLTGAGSVTGSVSDVASSGNIIAPGDSGIGTLAISGGLNLNGGSTLQYDLTNNPGGTNDKITLGGNLTLAGITTVLVNPVNGNLASGSYRLIDYTGSLTGNQSNFVISGASGARQSFAISTSTLHQVNLNVTGTVANLTWVGGLNSNAWDVNGTVNWSGAADNHFFNGDNVSFTNSGSNSPDINVVGTVAPSQITFSNSSTHNYNFTGGDITTGAISASGTATNTLANANVSAGSISVNGGSLSLVNSGTTNVSGNVSTSGSASLNLATAGATTITGSLTAGSSGLVSISNGALAVTGNFNSTGSGDVNINNTNFSVGGTFAQNGTGKVTIANSGTLSLPTAIAINSGTLAYSRGDDLVLSNNFSGAGTLRKEGSNQITFANTGNNSAFTGPIVVAGGTLKVTNGTGTGAGTVNVNALGTGDSGTTVLSGATLDLNGTQFPNEVITIEGFGNNGFDGALADTRNNTSRRALVKGIIQTGDASMRITPNGAPLVSSNSAPGSFINAQGFGFTLFGGGELSLDDLGDTHFGNVTVDGSKLWMFGNSTLGSNAGTVTLQNNAKLAFVGATTVTKPISVGFGGGEILAYGSSSSIDGQVTLNDELKLSVVSTPSITVNGQLTGGGGLSVHYVPGDSGSVVLTSDANDYTGITTIGGGSTGYVPSNVAPESDAVTLSIGNGGATGKLGTGDVINNATLQFNRTGTLAVPNNISGTGNVTAIAAGGVINLSGSNTYSGTTAVNAGILNVNGSNSAGGDFTVAGSATLGGNGSIGSNVVLQSAGHIAPGTSVGKLTISSGNLTSTGGVYNWQLGALKDQTTGVAGTDFDQIALSTGDLSLDAASSIALDFSLLVGTGPTSGNAFWSSGHSWKVIDTTSNTSGINFGSITGTAGSGTWSVTLGTGGDAGDVFLNYAVAALLNGDVNGDHIVNQLDLNVVFGNWLSTGATLAQGDANHDGVVNQLDINTITGNWLATGPVSGLANTSVPEPSSILLLAMSAIGFACRRRRRSLN